LLYRSWQSFQPGGGAAFVAAFPPIWADDNMIHLPQTEHVNSMNRKLAAILLLLTAFAVTACSTVEGVGQDISDTSRWVKNRL
jgi:predicted small secreted protein